MMLCLAVVLGGQAPSGADAPAPVDLLHALPTRVVPSSELYGSPTGANRMFDGDVSTVWRGGMEDLVGARISISLPIASTVVGLEMTIGEQALTTFRAQPRVERIRVSQAGRSLVEHTFDTDVRGMQRVSFQATGRDVIEIEVLAVRMGSDPTRRYIAVGELRLLGTHPRARPGRSRPRAGQGPRPTQPIETAHVEDRNERYQRTLAVLRAARAADAVTPERSLRRQRALYVSRIAYIDAMTAWADAYFRVCPSRTARNRWFSTFDYYQAEAREEARLALLTEELLERSDQVDDPEQDAALMARFAVVERAHARVLSRLDTSGSNVERRIADMELNACPAARAQGLHRAPPLP